MIKPIYNSSGKIVGTCDFTCKSIIVRNSKKPELIIDDEKVLNVSLSRVYNEDVVKYLYDDLTLSIGEIACVFDVHYHNANLWIKNNKKITSSKHSGRRNASYSRIFSEEQRQHQSESMKKYYSNGGEHHGYERTDEIRERISKSLKSYFESNTQNPEPHRDNWKNGKYEEVNFKRGIGGYITSAKIKKRFFFRSLLELFYIINFLEENDSVLSYQYEPFAIKCDNGSLYTPDFIINDNKVIEIKSYKFVYKQGGEIQEKFEYKCAQAKRYCDEHGLFFEVVFDKDINFRYDVLKHQLKDNNYILKYDIEFLQPERVWSRK